MYIHIYPLSIGDGMFFDEGIGKREMYISAFMFIDIYVHIHLPSLPLSLSLSR